MPSTSNLAQKIVNQRPHGTVGVCESANKLKSVQESSIYVQNHLPAATFDNQLLVPHSSLFDQSSQLARVQLRNTRYKIF